MSLSSRRYLVSGTVQGVGYRAFAQRVARELSLAGWVRNLPDGTVEALAHGPTPRLKRFATELRIGPPRAEVLDVRVEEVAATATVSGGAATGAKLEGFHIR
jgi:acylphosphatase